MKISPISVAQPRALKRVNKVSQKTNNFQATPAFKGWKAGLFSTIGTGVGIGVGTLLSGGLLAPLLCGMLGTMGGGIYGSSKEDYSSDY